MPLTSSIWVSNGSRYLSIVASRYLCIIQGIYMFSAKKKQNSDQFYFFHSHVEMLSFYSIIFVKYYLQNLNQ